MEDYMEYIKCGEVLISPSLNYKDQYILKCSECDECFSELSSLVVHHCTEHYGAAELDELIEGDEDKISVNYEDKISIKYELVSDMDMDQVSDDDNKEETLPTDDAYSRFSEESEDEYQEEECLIEYEESDEEFTSKTSTFVRNFMNSRTKVTALIAAYKNQPCLWNSNLPSQIKVKERSQCLQQIAEDLKEQINTQITSNQVAAVITRLRHDYREKLKRLKSDEKLGENDKHKKTRIWFFELLDFLKPFLENNSISILDSHQPQLEPGQIIHILGIYKRFPYLWNTNLIENVCTNKRLEALDQMRRAIESEMGLKTNIDTLKRYIHCVHIHFTREKRHNMNNIRTTKNRSILYKHMLFLAEHVGPFKCPECGRIFLSPLNLKVHISEHDGSIPLKCSLCNKEYKTTDAYMAHSRRHMNDLKNECKECGKKFSRPADLEIHQRCHTGAKPYCCEICGASYRHSQAFTTHKRRHEKQYLHNCPVCSKGFYKKDQMNNHIKTHTNIRDFICKVCGKAFKTKKTMQQHGFTHEEGRNHVCVICDKKFKNKIGLSQHMKIHRKNVVIENN